MTLHAPPRAHEVHLWRAPLDVTPHPAARFADTLSDGERDRAARLRGATDRARYIAAHGWMRQLLAGYLDADPHALVLVAEEHGKPRLTSPAVPWLRFNLSHSAAMVVFAVARDRDVGVDVEHMRDDVDFEGVARRLFTARQRAQLATLSGVERTAAFYAAWTRNEAHVKATGTGLAGADGFLDEPPGWTLTAFATEPGYAAAVAVRGDGVAVPATATAIGD